MFAAFDRCHTTVPFLRMGKNNVECTYSLIFLSALDIYLFPMCDRQTRHCSMNLMTACPNMSIEILIRSPARPARVQWRQLRCQSPSGKARLHSSFFWRNNLSVAPLAWEVLEGPRPHSDIAFMRRPWTNGRSDRSVGEKGLISPVKTFFSAPYLSGSYFWPWQTIGLTQHMFAQNLPMNSYR